jgi:hypothetical protein
LKDEMAEELDTEATPRETAELVVTTREPIGGEDHEVDIEKASPWPLRASPYV